MLKYSEHGAYTQYLELGRFDIFENWSYPKTGQVLIPICVEKGIHPKINNGEAFCCHGSGGVSDSHTGGDGRNV